MRPNLFSLLPVFSCLTISDAWTTYIEYRVILFSNLFVIKYKNVGSRLEGLDQKCPANSTFEPFEIRRAPYDVQLQLLFRGILYMFAMI